MNRVFLLGNLGKDPEVRYTQSGTAVVNGTLATSEKRGEEKHTEWHNFVAFGRSAEVIGEYCHKGSKIVLEGRLQTRSWEDRDGNKRYTTEVVVERFEFAGGKLEASDRPAGPRQLPPKEVSIPDYDIPF